jgi:AraC-like DNA-binding protein
LRRQQIERAKTLVHDPNLDLTQIAMILGCANQSSFGVAFKRETGLTPMQWRAREAVYRFPEPGTLIAHESPALPLHFSFDVVSAFTRNLIGPISLWMSLTKSRSF